MTEYRLNEEQLARLLDASKPVPAMFGSGGTPLFSTPQENANRVWRGLGEEMGFDYLTVRPIPGKGQEYFDAEPTSP